MGSRLDITPLPLDVYAENKQNCRPRGQKNYPTFVYICFADIYKGNSTSKDFFGQLLWDCDSRIKAIRTETAVYCAEAISVKRFNVKRVDLMDR